MIPSASGVQQGDPCGPLAFSWGIQDVCEAMEGLVDWQAWYLDDGLLLGTGAQLATAGRAWAARIHSR